MRLNYINFFRYKLTVMGTQKNSDFFELLIL